MDGSHAGFLATIYGTNFGPMGTAYASVRFEHSPLWSNASLAAEFECTDARVTVSHTTITCDVPPMYNADVGPFTTNLTLQYTAIVQIDNQVRHWSSSENARLRRPRLGERGALPGLPPGRQGPLQQRLLLDIRWCRVEYVAA